jgi:hypothetical protein
LSYKIKKEPTNKKAKSSSASKPTGKLKVNKKRKAASEARETPKNAAGADGIGAAA